MGCGLSVQCSLPAKRNRSKHKHRKHKHKSHHSWPDDYVVTRKKRRPQDHYVVKRTSSHHTPVVCRRTTRRERETIRVDGDVRHSRRSNRRDHEILSPRTEERSGTMAPSVPVSFWLCCLLSTRVANYGEVSRAGAACRRYLVDVVYFTLWTFGDEEIYYSYVVTRLVTINFG